MENLYLMEMLNRVRMEGILHTADRDRLIRQVEECDREHPLWKRVLAWAAGTGAYAVQDGGRVSDAAGAREVPGL